MNSKLILSFLDDIVEHNNRPWFLDHKADYMEVRAEWEQGVADALQRIVTFDSEIAPVSVRDCVYRFNRDTRFSPDKSPYKNHFGAYINAKGKKALRGGYYIHLERGHCLLAVGGYWLPTNILTACRNEIMAREEEWLQCVEGKDFLRWFGAPETSDWDSAQGFGLAKLKTCPSGFPKDYAHLRYLRQKDYCAWHRVSDDFFEHPDWFDIMEQVFRAGKPMMDFINGVVDDYE